MREPARIVRIIGQAPLAAAAWDCERLRCGGCGEVFTARAPAEAQGPKYDESAVAMMALLRYGAGIPLHRLDRLQRNLETPVPASTQWEFVRDRVSALEPVHEELRFVAAQGHVLHNDDTTVRILRKQGLRDHQRLEFHQRESGPVMAALKTWMNAELDEKRIEPNSGLGNAFRYLLKRWDKLTLFLRVPDAPLENNICERELKMAPGGGL